MPSLLIESAQILAGNELTPANILVEDGVIRSVSKRRPTSAPESTIDAKGLIALPGLIDAHVHLRDLELSYKETFETGTSAAAAGGYTTVFDMPNTRPPTVTATNLTEKMAKAQGKLYSNVAFQAGLVEDAQEVRKMAEQGAIAFKLYLNKSLETFNSSDQTALMNALLAAKQAEAIVTVHAEDGDSIKKSQQDSVARGKLSISDFLKAHAPAIEVSAVRRILGLGTKLNVHLHICHITVPEAVELVRMTPGATCEASAHHLLLNPEIFRKQRTLAICVPPIRREANRSRLWRLFVKGRVDILASDHAPHTLEEKMKQNAWEAASGVPGLETSLPMLLTQVSKGKLSLQRLVEATATLPAKLFHLPRKGKLERGYDADIVLVDPKVKSRVTPEAFLSKARYSPFKGLRCVGKAAYTLVNGELVAERGTIVGPPVGHVIRSERVCNSS